MIQQVHYEVLVCKSEQADVWVLHNTFDERSLAMTAARSAFESDGICGIRVVKETLDMGSGEFIPVTLFEQGGSDAPGGGRKEPRLPCSRTLDLYRFPARMAVADLMEGELRRQDIIPLEMLYRPDILKTLSASGNELRHAIQKWAIEQSPVLEIPVTDIIRDVTVLVSQGIVDVTRDMKDKVFPPVPAEGLVDVWRAVATSPRARYVLAGAIAREMSTFKTRAEKLIYTLKLMDNLPEDKEGRDICLSTIDDFVAEMIRSPGALRQLVGEQHDSGDWICVLVELVLGHATAPELAWSESLGKLATLFGQDQLPHARRVGVVRILGDLETLVRLCPDNIQKEVLVMRHLKERLAELPQNMATQDDILEQFERRSVRMAQAEFVEAYMERANFPDERIEFVLDLTAALVGSKNKGKLAKYIGPILTSPPMERHFLNEDKPILQRLGRLAALQVRVLRSTFTDEEKERLSGEFDQLAVTVENHGRLFQSISMRRSSVADKAVTMLRLLNANVLTEGECSRSAARFIADWTRDPSFQEALATVTFPMKKGMKPGDIDPVEEFKSLVQQTGILQMLKSADG